MNNKRPSSGSNNEVERKLGIALICYTNKRRKTYDPVFDAEIRKLRPDWFEDTARTNKDKLLDLARNGGKRPNRYSKDVNERKLSSALTSYTTKSGRDTYDPVFDTEIRKLRPDWFEDTARTNKDRLIDLARNHSKRPSNSSKNEAERKLGRALSRYTSKRRKTYDPIFDAEIRKLRPNWFEDTARINKDELLGLARNNGKRPNQRSKDDKERRLGSALTCYTNKRRSAYDPVFNTEIRKLRPDWFENTARINKGRLLELARNNDRRPNSKSKNEVERKLGMVFASYIGKGSSAYDPVFDAEIRKLRPDWFKS